MIGLGIVESCNICLGVGITMHSYLLTTNGSNAMTVLLMKLMPVRFTLLLPPFMLLSISEGFEKFNAKI